MTRINLWRELTAEEEEEFRAHARQNYEPFSDINPLWHPKYIEIPIRYW